MQLGAQTVFNTRLPAKITQVKKWKSEPCLWMTSLVLGGKRGIRKCASFFFLRFYLFIHERHRAEGEAGSTQEARRGTRSRVSRIRPWAEGGTKLLSHLGCPRKCASFANSYITHLHDFHHVTQVLVFHVSDEKVGPDDPWSPSRSEYVTAHHLWALKIM